MGNADSVCPATHRAAVSEPDTSGWPVCYCCHQEGSGPCFVLQALLHSLDLFGHFLVTSHFSIIFKIIVTFWFQALGPRLFEFVDPSLEQLFQPLLSTV